MIPEKRKKLRRPLRYTAWIGTSDNTSLLGCMVSDISESGAKLDVENGEELPDEFQLLLSGSGDVYRKCRTVWRTEKQIGVNFVKPSPVKVPPPRP